MSTVAFDTPAFAKRLQEVGVPPVQAEAHAIAQADFLTHHLLSEIATNADLMVLKTELKADIKALEVDIAQAATKADLTEMETKLTLRMLFMMGALATLITFFKFMG